MNRWIVSFPRVGHFVLLASYVNVVVEVSFPLHNVHVCVDAQYRDVKTCQSVTDRRNKGEIRHFFRYTTYYFDIIAASKLKYFGKL